MKIMNYVFIVLFAGSVQAGEQINQRDITLLRTYNNYAVVHLSMPGENLDGCSKINAASYVAVSLDSADGKEMYSAILSARVSGKPIGFGVSGCMKWGDEDTVPKIYRVDL